MWSNVDQFIFLLTSLLVLFFIYLKMDYSEFHACSNNRCSFWRVLYALIKSLLQFTGLLTRKTNVSIAIQLSSSVHKISMNTVHAYILKESVNNAYSNKGGRKEECWQGLRVYVCVEGPTTILNQIHYEALSSYQYPEGWCTQRMLFQSWVAKCSVLLTLCRLSFHPCGRD